MNTTIKIVLFTIVFSFFSTNALPDQLEDGAIAYNHGDYETAFRLYAPLAEQGVAEAQYRLGVLYAEGLGVPHNINEAVKLWGEAAQSENPQLAASARQAIQAIKNQIHGKHRSPPPEDRDIRCDAIRRGGNEFEIAINGC
jgi:Sel1 repeat